LLQSYLQSLPADSSLHQQTGTTSSFGDSAEMADELGALVVAGIKSATCSALWNGKQKATPSPK
jgi:uncharacterized protein YhfF